MSEIGGMGKKLEGKEFSAIGIFSVIYFVINFACVVLSGFHPILWMLLPGMIGLFASVPYLFNMAKVQKAGAVLIMGFITLLMYFVMDRLTVIMSISMTISCILAEIVRKATDYRSFKGNVISYMFFSYAMIGSPLPIWLFKEEFVRQIVEQGTSADYVAAIEHASTGYMLIISLTAPAVAALISAYITGKLFSKKFTKAGFVK